MYTLRTVLENGTVANVAIGDFYSIAKKGSARYKEIINNDKNLKSDVKEWCCVVFITAKSTQFLDKNDTHYIVTDEGKTFECLNRAEWMH